MYQVTDLLLSLTAVDCGSLPDPANGQVDHTAGTSLGQTAIYNCNTGYNLVGDSTRTCQATGNWSGSAPTCLGTYVINPIPPSDGVRHHGHTLAHGWCYATSHISTCFKFDFIHGCCWT